MPEFRPHWHPFPATEKRTPGTWTLIDSTGREYGTVPVVVGRADRGHDPRDVPLETDRRVFEG